MSLFIYEHIIRSNLSISILIYIIYKTEDQRTRGPQKIRGPEDQRTRGSEDQRIRGPEDQRTRGSEDQRTRGPEDQRTERTKILRFLGFQGSWSQNLRSLRARGHPGPLEGFPWVGGGAQNGPKIDDFFVVFLHARNESHFEA